MSSIDNGGNEDEAERLQREADKLREEIASLEDDKLKAEQDANRQQQVEVAAAKQRRDQYSAVVPILKPDGTTVMERVDFPPLHGNGKDGGGSSIVTCEANLPLGIILGESEEFVGSCQVDEVAAGSNGEMAGIAVGDIVRACTATKVEMEMPTWQLLAGTFVCLFVCF